MLQHGKSTRPSQSRSHQRRTCHALCKIGATRSALVGIIGDASAAGAQCHVANGLMPDVGDEVYLEWPDATACFARVVWVRGSRTGLQFTHLEPYYADKLDTAYLGMENYSRTIALQTALSKSRIR